jgi:sugar phosphate isomerase/epimerase
MNRRKFIQNSSLAVAAGSILPMNLMSCASTTREALAQNFGVALFTLPKSLSEDFKGTLKMISNLGYKELEFFGPYDYSSEITKTNWSFAANALGFSGSGYFGHSPSEAKMILDDFGLKSPSIHCDLDTLQENIGGIAEAAHIMGHKYVGIAMIPEDMRKNLDDYKRTIDLFNKIGESAHANGITFFYHNHGYGHQEMEGVIPFDLILKETDPEKVKMQMDVFWFTAAGVDPIKTLEANPGRFPLLHVKDMKEKKTFSGDGGNMQEWMGLFPFLTDAGQGVLPLEEILCAAKKHGAQHLFLEKDLTPEPELALKVSIDHLKGLKINC